MRGLALRLIIALAVLTLAGVGLRALAPADNHVLPLCFLSWAAGIRCPACGATRAAYYLLAGDLAQAIKWNALLVFWFPLAALVFVTRPRLLVSPYFMWALLFSAVGFFIARQLPFYPFPLPAP